MIVTGLEVADFITVKGPLHKPTNNNFMKTTSILLVAAFGALFTSCETNTNQKTEKASINQQQPLSENEKEFIEEAAKSNMLELELGQLADKKASSKEVKEFADKMKTGHSQANTKLKQLAKNKNVSLPDSIAEDGMETKQDLAKLTGTKFDKKYIEEMLDNHKKDVNKFEDMAEKAEDPEVKNFAQQTLPSLKNHYMEAQQLDSMLEAKEKKKKSNKKTSMK